MKPARFFSMVLGAAPALLWLVSQNHGFAREWPPFEGAGAPAPLAQAQPWTAPSSNLPPPAVQAMADLFAAGFADPRGCEYREVELRRPLGFGRKPVDEALAAHGWVLPERADDPMRYAIAWDGLVYPLLSVGAPADLDADAARILSEQPRPDQVLVKIPLLLRLGKVELAGKLWQWWVKKEQEATRGESGAESMDPFAHLATVWLRAAHERVLRPHLHSQAKLALVYLQLLPDYQAAVEKFATQRGLTVATTPVRSRPASPSELDLTFLDQVPALLADEQRRVRENITNRDEVYAPASIPDKKQRIALLVRDLEDVEAYPMLSRGSPAFGQSAVVRALIAQGDDAVDPLLDCFENDRRFTRSVNELRIAGVEEPAFVALQGILKTTEQFAELDRPHGPGLRKVDRAAAAAQLRQYWAKFRDKTLPQRWYAVLADDSAAPEAWAEVASFMVWSVNQELPLPGFMRSVFPEKPREPVRGESLRGELQPSVSDLLAQRLRETLNRAKASKESFPFSVPQKLAVALARWDGKRQEEVLRWSSSKLLTFIAQRGENADSDAVDLLISIYLARAGMGDTQALAEFAQWIRSVAAGQPVKGARSFSARLLAPIWQYPEDPTMRELAGWLFSDPHSPWFVKASQLDVNWVSGVMHLPLLGVPAFRALILEQLQNRSVVGQIERTSPYEMKVTFGDHSSDSRVDDPDAPPVGLKADLRWTDVLARQISEIRGAPAFKLYWPVERRDRAIEQTSAFLRQYGGQLFRGATRELDEELRGLSAYYDLEWALRFAPLDHPATREDVAAGRALFSLEGQGERRTCPLPQFPTHAAWSTLREYPSLDRQYGPTARFDQSATIWQAEEVLIDGKWQRYYGMVAKNRFAAVPAEEVRFGTSEQSEKLDGWSLTLNLPGSLSAQSVMSPAAVRTGDAVPVTIFVSNQWGTDRVFPKATNVARSSTADEIGLEVRVAYSQRPRGFFFTFDSKPEAKWSPVVANTGARQVDLPVSTEKLAPTKGTALVQFDLAKWFDLTMPGTYAATLKFTKGGLLESDAEIPMQYLEITR